MEIGGTNETHITELGSKQNTEGFFSTLRKSIIGNRRFKFRIEGKNVSDTSPFLLEISQFSLNSHENPTGAMCHA